MHVVEGIVDLTQWSAALSDYVLHPFIMIILCLLSIFVVLGNLLVVTAIWHEHQLHSVTNYLIASLAAADCLVGAIVMPFSIISENIVKSWTFGATWCDMWHSFDVLASTASIMNLCAISLDRYLAITNPISYPRKMTPKRVALLIVSLWTCSSLISFPAIIWWRAVGQGPLQKLSLPLPQTTTISATSNATYGTTDLQLLSNEQPKEAPLYKCVFTDDTYYLLFSSIVSFYGPLCIMLYAYCKIYTAAVQQTRFLKHGSKQVMVGRGKKIKRLRNVSEHSMSNHDRCDTSEAAGDPASQMDGYDKQHLVLRAHRGGGGGGYSKPGNGCAMNASKNSCDMKRRENNDCDQSAPKDKESQQQATDINNPAQLPRTNSQNLKRVNHYSKRHSIKDRLKVDRQRFETEPINEGTATNISEDKNNCPIANGTLEVEVKLDKSRGDHESNRDRDSPYPVDDKLLNNSKLKQSITKSLLATINHRSTSVDVSVIDHSLSRHVSNSHLQAVNLNKRFPRKVTRYADAVDLDDTGSDEYLEGESLSGSSSSYGTGSIVSVLVRPQTASRDPDEKPNDESTNCDTNDGSNANNSHRLRRAMSYGETSRKDRVLWKQMADGSTRQTIICIKNPTSTDDQVDCGIKKQQGKHNTRALDFRSWIKLSSKMRGSKNINCSQESKTMKPPPSLVPLIMMNSDTSTDSSLPPNAMNSKRIMSVDEGVMVMRKTDLDFASHKSRTHQDLSSGEESIEKERVGPAYQLEANKSPADKIDQNGERTKNQVVYYDSDKLVHSVVDLTAIRYIDCSDQNDRQTSDNSPQNEEVEAPHLNYNAQPERSRQIQLLDSERIHIPRQNRSVGKKLSKLAKERKAAKTLGIVVGVFILCWLPFFVVNIIVALCGIGCIYNPQLLLSIVTWLGWLNSAMNPVIYACWSRDFRRAFRRVLCTWVEFLCPYDGSLVARKLRLKKSSNYSQHDAYSNRYCSSVKANTSSTIRSGASLEGGKGQSPANGGLTRSLLSDP